MGVHDIRVFIEAVAFIKRQADLIDSQRRRVVHKIQSNKSELCEGRFLVIERFRVKLQNVKWTADRRVDCGRSFPLILNYLFRAV